MSTYKHSVYLEKDRCKGCTACLQHCPTEAIRIKNGHAVINAARCIDCGECVRVCSHKAKQTVIDKIEDTEKYKYKIALPAPSLYAQFENLDDIDYVLQGLLDIGFDSVFEVSRAAELVSAYTRNYLKTDGIKKPVISSACPAVIRLIELRFPILKDNIIKLLPPVEIAAYLAVKEAKEKNPDLSDEDICVCFITPCPAKVSYIKNGFGEYKSRINTVISINDIYFLLLSVMNREKNPKTLSKSGIIGIGWAISGGESAAVFSDKYLAADGIENVIHILDQIENGNIPNVEFVELNACTGGCVGGVLTVQNPFISKAKLQGLRKYLPVSQNCLTEEELKYIPDYYFFNKLPEYSPITFLSSDMAEAMRMMADIHKIREKLPGIDCGSCGAPNCKAFAEDIVKGTADINDCIIRYKSEFKEFLKSTEENCNDCT